MKGNQMGISITAKCDECGREFNLLEEGQAEEYAFGHDCEVGA